MLRWNIDFLAVSFIAVVMLGFSKMPSLGNSFQFQNAVSANSCPLQVRDEVLSRIAYILNQ
jgi:hypothetical protein